jgi:hypothetical protein
MLLRLVRVTRIEVQGAQGHALQKLSVAVNKKRKTRPKFTDTMEQNISDLNSALAQRMHGGQEQEQRRVHRTMLWSILSFNYMNKE